MQPIRVQTSPGQVQLAIMHIAELDASTEDLRGTAMHLRSPIHTLMFNSKGELLAANTMALRACHEHVPGTPHPLPGMASGLFRAYLSDLHTLCVSAQAWLCAWPELLGFRFMMLGCCIHSNLSLYSQLNIPRLHVLVCACLALQSLSIQA